MRAGQLRHKITFQKKRETKDTIGAIVTEWLKVCCVHGSILPISGKENFSSQHFNAETNVKIMVRSSTTTRAITPKHRIISGGIAYNIDGIVPDVTNRINLRFLCSRAYDDRFSN